MPSLVTFLLKNTDLVDRYDLSSLKTVLCGSGSISGLQIKEFQSKFTNVTNFLRGFWIILNKYNIKFRLWNDRNCRFKSYYTIGFR